MGTTPRHREQPPTVHVGSGFDLDAGRWQQTRRQRSVRTLTAFLVVVTAAAAALAWTTVTFHRDLAAANALLDAVAEPDVAVPASGWTYTDDPNLNAAIIHAVDQATRCASQATTVPRAGTDMASSPHPGRSECRSALSALEELRRTVIVTTRTPTPAAGTAEEGAEEGAPDGDVGGTDDGFGNEDLGFGNEDLTGDGSRSGTRDLDGQ